MGRTDGLPSIAEMRRRARAQAPRGIRRGPNLGAMRESLADIERVDAERHMQLLEELDETREALAEERRRNRAVESAFEGRLAAAVADLQARHAEELQRVERTARSPFGVGGLSR